ncbi:MAG TPA: hypothetical protein ENI65_06470 [Gammaproteobacteria bacterium]|nr:hypothetical protein [Gammaproteobacteria bacterium]
MKTVLRVTSGVLALMSLVVVVLRIYSMSNQESASITQIMGLVFPLSVAMFCGYMAIKGRMPLMNDQKSPPSDLPKE